MESSQFREAEQRSKDRRFDELRNIVRMTLELTF
jgi:hypothetical protein